MINEETIKILIIKLAARGDVLRTTSLLHGLKRKFPKSKILWITGETACELLENNPYIDSIIGYNPTIMASIGSEIFDILICLDKEREATELATKLQAKQKIGFGINGEANLIPLNKESFYAYRLGISDELKFKINKKTYQEIIYEMCSLEYRNDCYIFNLDKDEIEKARGRLNELGVYEKDTVIGLNTGAGNRFANKSWPKENYETLIQKLLNNNRNMKILLLGGKEEELLNRSIEESFDDRVYNAGSDNTVREFACIVNSCDVVISGDTLAMHIGIALGKYTIALFGPTCPQEIDLYEKGAKIITDIECAPCYKQLCPKKEHCMSRISPEVVFDEIMKGVENGKRYRCKAVSLR